MSLAWKGSAMVIDTSTFVVAPTLSGGGGASGDSGLADAPMRAAARAFEAAFLARMLDHAGLGRVPSALGGGPGEGQFASFLVQAQAERLAAAGGIGLAEAIYATLDRAASETVKRADAAG
jgi:flagellar protein FlgJ